jgi:ubiquinone biosynthesis protein COQ4
MDPDTAYVMCRYRQVHDFWHVLADLPPTVLGEIALKWFELKATGLPVCLFSGLLGPLKLSQTERLFLVTEYLPWVMRSKSRCDKILSFRYEDNMHRSLDDIRAELGIEIAPRGPIR